MMNRSDRKKHLIAQGVMYRIEVLHAKQAAQEQLQPAMLARSAFRRLPAAALGLFGKGGSTGMAGIGIRAALPLLVSGVAALKHKSLLKPVLRGVLASGAVAATVAFVVRRTKSRRGTVGPANRTGES